MLSSRGVRSRRILPRSRAGQYVAVDAETQTLRHSEGCASTPWNPSVRGWALSLPRRNHPGDSRAKRENDSNVFRAVVATSATNRGILRLLTQALNDGRECGRGRVALSSVILAKRGSHAQGLRGTSPLPQRNHPGDCVVAKSAGLRFRLAAKASLAPLLLLFGRDPLRRVRVRDGGCRLRSL